MPKANIRYQHIEEQFPLRGQYIFRFKVMHDNNVVWLDLQDPQSRLPTFKERVFVKATRISWDPSEHVKNPYKFEAEKTKVTAPPEVQPKQASNIELLSDPPAPQPKQSTFMNIDNDLLIWVVKNKVKWRKEKDNLHKRESMRCHPRLHRLSAYRPLWRASCRQIQIRYRHTIESLGMRLRIAGCSDRPSREFRQSSLGW